MVVRVSKVSLILLGKFTIFHGNCKLEVNERELVMLSHPLLHVCTTTTHSTLNNVTCYVY